LIFDEVDTSLYNDPKAWLHFVRKNKVIGLTASPSDTIENGLEAQILKWSKFKIFEDNYLNSTKKDAALEFEEKDFGSNCQRVQYLNSELNN